eukprot:9484390-Pyramimonas_sp.AAC.1
MGARDRPGGTKSAAQDVARANVRRRKRPSVRNGNRAGRPALHNRSGAPRRSGHSLLEKQAELPAHSSGGCSPDTVQVIGRWVRYFFSSR